jgi:hypothetical protein
MASVSSEGQAFCGLTTMPGSTGRRHERTLGSSPICTRQLGQWPVAQNRPRGRWYLKERLKVRTPAAYRAEAMVSPGWAW